MNATQWVGIISFGGASILCLCIRQWPWTFIGGLNMIMAIECGLGMRHRVHNFAVDLMGPFYLNRVGVQIGLTFIVASIVFFTSLLLLNRSYGRAHATIIAATGSALALFSVETISLHAFDSFLYQKAGSLLMIGWIWMGIGSVIAIGALRRMSLSSIIEVKG